MNAQDYPISFPYGETGAPYSAAHPHRGDDRACPTGTPVVIAGVTIGLTDSTGKSTGPHLHIQEWQDSYTNTRKPQNAFKPGTVVNIDPTQSQGDGSFGKFITIRNADGWNDSYCHLEEILVTVGQKLEGKEDDLPNDGDITNELRRAKQDPNYQPTGEEFRHYKDPAFGWKALAYDTSNAMQAFIDSKAKPVVLKPGDYVVK